jgi:hypothetical protein
MPSNNDILKTDTIVERIYFVRGEKVMLDVDLAILYGTETKRLKEAVRRNIKRFPPDFMFELTREEFDTLKYQFGTSNDHLLRSQIASSNMNNRRGGTRYLPFAFTEQGVAMLSGVLNSQRAIEVNIAIMRAFVQLRSILASHHELSLRLEALEQRYDEQFRGVFEAIKQLMKDVRSQNTRLVLYHRKFLVKTAPALRIFNSSQKIVYEKLSIRPYFSRTSRGLHIMLRSTERTNTGFHKSR